MNACGGGSDDPDPSPTPNPDITSISINATSTDAEVGKSISFTVTGNTGASVTASSTIYINGVAITGFTYTPEQSGNITVSAQYKQLLSNSLVIIVKPKPITSIKVSSDNLWVNLDNEFTFKVEDSNAFDVTQDATLFVNTFEIEGNTFSPNSYGTYNIHATYAEFTSETIVLSAQEGPTAFTKKVLIEDFTGTWCGWCPRVSYGIERVQQETDHAVVAAIHRGARSDPYHFDESNISQLDEGRYPIAKLNRTILWEGPEPSNTAQVLNLVEDHTDLGLSIKTNLAPTNMEIDVYVGFLSSFENAKLVVYLVEDHLFYNQTNYTQYYDGADILIDFEHNNVLRKVLTNLFGDPIPSDEANANDEYHRHFSLKVPATVSNSDNLKVVAFVVDSSGEVLNVQSSAVNSYKNYD
jgi:hypothetical protein